MRPWILRLHRWATFALGAIIVFVCVTGSLSVFGDELDRLGRPSYFAATPGDVGPDSALAAISAALPGRRVSRLWYPRPAQPVYVGEVPGNPIRFVHVDPGTGHVLGVRGEPVMTVIRHLHANLLAGAIGARMVGYLGVALLLMMVSGIWLWWPGLRKLPLGFRFRRRGGAALVNYDLHNITGIVTMPLLALITLTGAALVFGSAARVVLYAAWLQTPQPMPRGEGLRVPPADSRPMLAVADLVRRAQDTIPGHEVVAIVLPSRDGLGLRVRMTKPGVRLRDGLVRVLVDPHSGEIAGTVDTRGMAPPDVFARTWLMPLHAGDYGGVPMRLVYFVIGLVPVGLAGTGLVVWWLRRGGRLALAERRAARVA